MELLPGQSYAQPATTIIANLTRAAADPLLELVRGGIGGAVIAATLGKPVQSERREPARV
jgi:hypothetical protein